MSPSDTLGVDTTDEAVIEEPVGAPPPMQPQQQAHMGAVAVMPQRAWPPDRRGSTQRHDARPAIHPRRAGSVTGHAPQCHHLGRSRGCSVEGTLRGEHSDALMKLHGGQLGGLAGVQAVAPTLQELLQHDQEIAERQQPSAPTLEELLEAERLQHLEQYHHEHPCEVDRTHTPSIDPLQDPLSV